MNPFGGTGTPQHDSHSDPQSHRVIHVKPTRTDRHIVIRNSVAHFSQRRAGRHRRIVFVYRQTLSLAADDNERSLFCSHSNEHGSIVVISFPTQDNTACMQMQCPLDWITTLLQQHRTAPSLSVNRQLRYLINRRLNARARIASARLKCNSDWQVRNRHATAPVTNIGKIRNMIPARIRLIG